MTGQHTTRESLAIFWEGEEQDGIMAYGFWPTSSAPAPSFPAQAWPAGTQWKATQLFGTSWSVWLWEIRFATWPLAARWRETIRATLEALRAGGAAVVWCGLEGYFADPPSLFDPSEMSGGVWAVLGPEELSAEPPGLTEPFHTVPDALLLEVRKRLGMPAAAS